jgi:hypothetical protein
MKTTISRRAFLKESVLATIILTGVPLIAKGNVPTQKNVKVDADSLIPDIETYTEKNVEIEGDVIHICPVNGKKIKLKTAQGNIIKIVPDETALQKFDKSLNQKHIHVTGQVSEERVDHDRILQYAKNQTLLCHIDYTRCIDGAWIDSMVASGKASKYIEDMTKKLTDEMQKTKKNYISVVKITTTSISTNA